LPAQYRSDLKVHEFWRAQPFPAQAGTGTVAVRAVIAKGGGQDAGINDDHDRRAASRPPPSAEPKSLICTLGTSVAAATANEDLIPEIDMSNLAAEDARYPGLRRRSW
jgi:hypothetical protein